MKVSERLDLNRAIADELAKRYSWDEIAEFLRAFDLQNQPDRWEDEADYARQTLSKASLSTLSEIVEDLGLAAFSEIAPERQLPAIWKENGGLRVFVSHLSSEKDKAARLRDCMKSVSMSAFVAHEDIEPTLEWQVQIERALNSMDLFISVHTDGFSKSVWTQQEIGYAVAKGVKIIAVRMGEDPTGFIQKNQALSRGTKRAEQLVQEIKTLVLKDERLREKYERDIETDLKDDVPF
jgi:hypothetical protein